MGTMTGTNYSTLPTFLRNESTLRHPFVAEIPRQPSNEIWQELAHSVLILFVLRVFTCRNELG